MWPFLCVNMLMPLQNVITHLADDVHKVKKLTNDKLIDVAGMGVDVSNKVICDCCSSVLLCIFIKKFRGI